ncbi:MFS transporter [Bacillus infantis]|uniref:MFS transporter n=1 Tax=Bacillus infantis TaxID=324767 RepID=UPI003CF0BD79
MFFKSLNPTIQIRLFLLFISTMSTMTVLPYLIIYLSIQVGNIIAGILFLLVMFVNILGSILGGYISDRIGRKKIILLSEFTIFIGFIGAAFANSPEETFPYITFIFFLFIHFSTGAVNPVYQALIIDISKPEERRSIYTYSYWIRNLGIAIGSLIGAFLFFDYLFLLFLGVSVIALCIFFITYLFIQETYTPVKEKSEKKKHMSFRMLRSYTKVLSHRFFTVFSIASLLIVSVEEQLTNYIGVRLANEIYVPVQLVSFLSLEIDGVNLLGILKTENTLLVVAFTMLITQVIRTWNDRYVLLIGLLLFFSGYTVISISTTPSILIIAMLIASFGEMMYIPVKETMLSKIVPDHARSTYMALYSITVILGVSTAGILLIISSWLSPLALTSFIGFMGAVNLVLFFNLTKFEKSIIKQKEKTM